MKTHQLHGSSQRRQIVDAQLILPTAWLDQHGVAAGTMLPLNIPELQVEGAAFVESVEQLQIKGIGEISPEHKAQLLNYLKATGL